MPGVEKLLLTIKSLEFPSCVVTNSPSSLTDAMKRKQPLLSAVKNWVTRELYAYAKPAPDSYLKALELYAKKESRALGFEDTFRGWKALDAAGVEGIVVSSCLTQEMKRSFQEKNVYMCSSFEDLFD